VALAIGGRSRGGFDEEAKGPKGWGEALRAHLKSREESRPRHHGLEIAPDEVEAFMLFSSVQTQWNWHPVAGMRTGLNYGAINPASEMLGVTMSPSLFLDVRMMESAALAAWAKKV
jgi:Phage related hypothetical protein (DUF1799)